MIRAAALLEPLPMRVRTIAALLLVATTATAGPINSATFAWSMATLSMLVRTAIGRLGRVLVPHRREKSQGYGGPESYLWLMISCW